MSQTLLKLNHFLFRWYYKRVDKHFWQWPFKKSVRLLIQHYNHEQFCHKGTKELYDSCYKRVHELDKELKDIKFKQVATDEQIKWANDKFGTDFTQRTDN